MQVAQIARVPRVKKLERGGTADPRPSVNEKRGAPKLAGGVGPWVCPSTSTRVEGPLPSYDHEMPWIHPLRSDL
jgi:hypothetical protein